MRKALKKAMPLLLTLCLLLGLLPLGGLMASAGPTTFTSKLQMVGLPVEGVIRSVFNNDKILCLHNQNWDSAGLTNAIPSGAKLVVKYDTTKVSGTGGLNFFIDTLPKGDTQQAIWNSKRINFLTDTATQMVTLVNKDGKWTTVKGASQGEGCYGGEKHMGLPLGTSGYVIIDTPTGYELNNLSGWFFFRWDIVNADVLEDSFKIQIGWVAGDVAIPTDTEMNSGPAYPTPPSDVAGDVIRGTIPSSEAFGDNYVVTDSSTQTIQIGGNMTSNPIVNLRSLASAPSSAEALVFRFSIPNIELFVPEGGGIAYNEQDRWTHASYWNFMAFAQNFTGNAAASGGRYVPYSMYYFKDEIVNVNYGGWLKWADQLPLNCEGYVMVKISDLQSFAKAKFGKGVTVSDIEEMAFNQEWNWYAGLYNKQIYISDIGYVMSASDFAIDFEEAYVPAYEKEVLEPKGGLTAKTDRVEGTYVDLSWSEFKGAKRYMVNIYTKDGFHGVEKTRKTSYRVEGLSLSTDYKIQIVPIDGDQKILGASNVLQFKTAEKNSAPYLSGLIEYDETLTATVEDSMVNWKWVTGVNYYAIHLYEKNGDKLTFVSRATTESEKGTYKLNGLEGGKEYTVQLVAYTSDDSIVFAYAPTDSFVVPVTTVPPTSSTTTATQKPVNTTAKEDTDVTTPTIPIGGDDIVPDVTTPIGGDDFTPDTTTPIGGDDFTPDTTTPIGGDDFTPDTTTPIGGDDFTPDTTTTIGDAPATDATTSIGGDNEQTPTDGEPTSFPIGIVIAIVVVVAAAVAGAVVFVIRQRQKQQDALSATEPSGENEVDE